MAIDEDFLRELSSLRKRTVYSRNHESLRRHEENVSKEINVIHKEESLLKELLEKLRGVEAEVKWFLEEIKEASLIVYNEILVELDKLHKRLSVELNKPAEEIALGNITPLHREVIDGVIQRRLVDINNKKKELLGEKRSLLEKIGQLERDYHDLETSEKDVGFAKHVEQAGVSISEATKPLHRGYIPQWVFIVALIAVVLLIVLGSWLVILSTTLGWNILLTGVIQVCYNILLGVIVSAVAISLILLLKRALKSKRVEAPRSSMKFQTVAIVVLLLITYFLYQNLSETSKLMNFYNTSYHSTEDELGKVRKIVVDKDSVITQKEDKILSLEKDLSATKQSLTESKNNIQVLNDELSKQRNSLTNLQMELVRREEELKQAQSQVVSSQEQLKEKEERIRKTQQDILSLSQELGSVENRILSLESWVKKNAYLPDDILSSLSSNYGTPSRSVPDSDICYIDTCQIGRTMGNQFTWTDDLATSGSYDHLFDVRNFWNSKKGDCDDFAFFGSAWVRSEINLLSDIQACKRIYVALGQPDENGYCLWPQAEKTVEIVNDNQIYMVCGMLKGGSGHCEVGILDPTVSDIDPEDVYIFEPQAGVYRGTQPDEFSFVWSLSGVDDYIEERSNSDSYGKTYTTHIPIINNTKEQIEEVKNTLKTLI